MPNPIPSQSDLDLAKRKLAELEPFFAEICDLTGKSKLTVNYERSTPPARTAVAIRPLSHEPLRYPMRPFPIPKKGQRSGKFHNLLVSPLSLEVDRREAAARLWSEKVDHLPPLHHTDPSDIDLKIIHHSDCANKKPFLACDCGLLVLCRFAGQTFAVMADGSMEEFTQPPPKPSDFRDDAWDYFEKHSWYGLISVLYTSFAYTTVGEGDDERFVEFPLDPEIQAFLNNHDEDS